MAKLPSWITRILRPAQDLSARTGGVAVFDPMDMAHAAEAIVASTLTRLKTTEKLILALGENHTSHAHRLTSAKVLTRLHEEGIPVTFAIEQDTTSLLREFLQDRFHLNDHAHRTTTMTVIQHLDPNGHLRAGLILAFGAPNDTAPLEMAVAHNIPVIFADAARNRNDHNLQTEIDLDHAATRAVADDLGYTNIVRESGEPINAISVMGTHLRNEYMLRTLAQAEGLKRPGPHVIVLQTGRTHVGGTGITSVNEARMRASLNMEPRAVSPFKQSLHGLSAHHRLAFHGAVMLTASEQASGVAFHRHAHTHYLALPDNDQITDADVENALRLPLAPALGIARIEAFGKDAIGQLAVIADMVEKIGPAAFKLP